MGRGDNQCSPTNVKHPIAGASVRGRVTVHHQCWLLSLFGIPSSVTPRSIWHRIGVTRHEESIETRTSSNAPHSDHIEDIPFATASAPYTRSELSDLIFRTLDGVFLCCCAAALLRLSSPFFNRKFPPENHNSIKKDGLVVIDAQEDSNVLFHLLGFIYPTPDPDVQSAGLYTRLVFAARKYEMVNVEYRMKKHSSASPLVTAEPLRVYPVASVLGWASLAKTAALNTLRTPLHHDELSFVDEMHLMTGAQLFRLMHFRFVCTDATCDALKIDAFDF